MTNSLKIIMENLFKIIVIYDMMWQISSIYAIINLVATLHAMPTSLNHKSLILTNNYNNQ
jgi:hypothetical protein